MTPSIMSPSAEVKGRSASRTATTPPSPSRERRIVLLTPTMRGGLRKPGTTKPSSPARCANTRAAAVNFIVADGVMDTSCQKGVPASFHALSRRMTNPSPNVSSVVDTELNPLQQTVLDELGLPTGWEPLPSTIVTSIETQLLDLLAPIDGLFTPDNPLRVNKHHLATVHGCEKFHMLQREAPFAWNINTVRGTIAHKAIELMLNWNEPVVPRSIVDAAITSVAENPRESASEFISALPAHELAELRGAVVSAVTTFIECFPPIKPAWRPIVEYSASYSMFGGSVIFTSRMDLVLGAPGRKVIIDLKTGRLSQTHRDDLRFYALIETLRSRMAPRQVGSYSLDAARLDSEDVSEGLLQAAVRRAAQGTLLIADLVLHTREPDLRPGFQCRWCPINHDCPVGQKYLRELSGDDEDSEG